MGRYLNPRGQSKEDWLITHAEMIGGTPPETHINPGFNLVCWVNNGAFTAVGLCNSEKELKAMSDPNDPRATVWFWIPEELAVEFK